jgi:osmotically inducible protein OsmC
MATERSATCTWTGDLVGGRGSVSLGSGAATDLPATWASRTSRSDGMTSPEELIAAAHASCFSMALTHGLTDGGFAAERLEVSATVTLEELEGVPTITTSDIDVTGAVPGIDPGTFILLATDAGRNCPVSRALGPLEISVRAVLAEASDDGVLDHPEPLDLDADDVA